MTKNYNDLGVEFKYLIVNDMDQRYGLWVNTVGFQSIQPNSPYPLKDHPTGYFFNAQKGRILREYQLVYITKGPRYYRPVPYALQTHKCDKGFCQPLHGNHQYIGRCGLAFGRLRL